jgi:glycosyltransferase involved in cell wall biosynthesis
MVNVLLRIPGTLATYRNDLTWIQRRFVPSVEFLVRLSKGPRVLDVDDAVWMEGFLAGNSARTLARNVDAVIAGNAYLADWYSQVCRKVYVLPTAIDCERFKPSAVKISEESRRFVVVWTGSHSTLRFLEMIEGPLLRFLERHPQSALRVICDERPGFTSLGGDKLEFVQWKESIEAECLRDASVGIMPLEDDLWSRGKCSFKMLQYMACALPVVVSPIGMNGEILSRGECGFAAKSDDDWVELLDTLYSSSELRTRMGNTGRSMVEAEFSKEKVATRLAQIFREVLGVS